ncbi:Transposase DDE domain protein [Stieleria magnilauensis]|uniref:Transposase DDE domain protein n=1 Tax=Stieleria magnilauensis TaxID=2527963 RepID=A0ABX5XYB2_9BACT|nr:Transposase DDE domain protein [Planctomycetes bacterium TBK1r]
MTDAGGDVNDLTSVGGIPATLALLVLAERRERPVGLVYPQNEGRWLSRHRHDVCYSWRIVVAIHFSRREACPVSQRQPKTSYWQEAPTPRGQLVLIPTALEELIPQDHPVRLVDEILDQMDWTDWEAAYNGGFGQPPIHPSVMAKILLFAMIRRIRSSRNIEYELKHSIDFIWLSSGRRIDHSTISDFRRNNSDAVKGIFKQMVKLAINLGIANLSELCIDGTRILADANKYKTWTAKRLAKALEELDAQIDEALETFEVNDACDEDLIGQDVSADRLPAAVANLKSRRSQLAAHLETVNAMDEVRRKNGTKGPAQLPKTDTDSRILPNKEGGYAANFTPMATTETQSGLIVAADVLIGNVEHHEFATIVDCVANDFGIDIKRVMADSAYTTGKNLTAAEEKQIELIGPLAETNRENNPAERSDLTEPVAADQIDQLPVNPQTKRFDKAAFVYDEANDCYYCPAGKVLSHRTTENTTHGDGSPVQRKVYTCFECEGCTLAGRCRKNVKPKDEASSSEASSQESSEATSSDKRAGKRRGRKPGPPRGRETMHDEHEGARRRQRARMETPAAKEAYSRRQHFGETPFAVIKSTLDMRRFLLRGIAGVNQEWRWAATGFNLKKIMSYLAKLRAAAATQSLGTAN